MTFEPEIPAVFVAVDARSGVTHYRCMLPAQALKASMLVRTTDLTKMKLVGDDQAPVAVYSMPRSEEMFQECMQIIAHPDRALIIDLDDCLRAVVQEGSHPGSKDWATILDKHEWLIGRADAVTCTTEFLAQYARDLGAENVHIIPNALDLGRWNGLREARSKDFTVVGWSGSRGHEAAIAAHMPALVEFMQRDERIAVVGVGMPIGQHFPAELGGRVRDLGFIPISKHPIVLQQFHINIGPTLDNDIYRAKSDLRALEAFASDSYFIGGRTTYGNLHGDAAIIDRPEDLVTAIEVALDHPKLNHDQRKAAGKYVRENRTMADTAPLWKAAILGVIP